MSDLGKNLDEQSYHARADRRYTQGLVIAIDSVQHTCTLDVGGFDVRGNPVPLEEVPFQPQTPPSVGDKVGLTYANASPHSVAVAGGALSGQNVQSSLQVVGAVTSLAAAGGGTPLQGPVLIAGAGTVTVSEAGHTITLTGGGVAGVKAESGGGAEVGPESTLNFVAGTNVTSITVVDNAPDIDITINAAAPPVTSVNGLTGAVTLSLLSSPLTTRGDVWGYSSHDARVPAGTDGYVLTADSTQVLGVKWAASVGSSNAPTWPVTVVASGTTVYTALSTDTALFCYTETTAQTITLPNAAAYPGKLYVIFDAYQGATQGITVAATGPSVIVGISTIHNASGTARKSVTYISDGTNWHSFTNTGNN